MGMFFQVFAPLAEFFVKHGVIILTAVVIYLILSFLFKGARGAISIIFGAIVLIWLLSNLGGVYDALGELFTNLGDSSTTVSEQYAKDVDEKYMSDDNLTTEEKLRKSIEYGLLGRE